MFKESNDNIDVGIDKRTANLLLVAANCQRLDRSRRSYLSSVSIFQTSSKCFFFVETLGFIYIQIKNTIFSREKSICFPQAIGDKNASTRKKQYEKMHTGIIKSRSRYVWSGNFSFFHSCILCNCG